MERSSEPGQMISRVSFRPDINDSDDRTSKLIISRQYFDDLWASLMAQQVKNLAHNAGDLGLIPGLGRSPGEGNGYPLQYPGLENSMDCIGHGVAKSQT